jgi:hypothetical protein
LTLAGEDTSRKQLILLARRAGAISQDNNKRPVSHNGLLKRVSRHYRGSTATSVKILQFGLLPRGRQSGDGVKGLTHVNGGSKPADVSYPDQSRSSIEDKLGALEGMSRSLLKIAKRSLRLETYAASAI